MIPTIAQLSAEDHRVNLRRFFARRPWWRRLFSWIVRNL